jgi:hypothetical protein
MRFSPLFLALLATPALGQAPGTCAHGTATALLDANLVQARLFNNGNLFYGESASGAYYVPDFPVCGPQDDQPCSPLFAADLWVGGHVGGELRAAAATYEHFEFWPGPLDDAGNPPADCAAYDRIWIVSRADVERFYETGEVTDDLRDWPAGLGAPVLDGDGIAGNYNLAGGDQPAVWGEQTAWWVMNDAGNTHETTGSPPVGLEVQVTAFALFSSYHALKQSTLYRYRLVNRGGAALDSAYVALWLDPDLGDPFDDYLGSDTLLAMGFVYNGDDFDDAYGVPPAAGFQVLQGPVGLPNGRDDDADGMTDEDGERLGMTAFMKVREKLLPDPPCPVSNPLRWVYNQMQGRFCDGTPMTEGGDGYGSGGNATTVAFPGDPTAGQFWSEVNADGGGTPLDPGDRRAVLASGPFRLDPGETEEVVFALVFEDGVDHLNAVTELRAAARLVRSVWEAGYFDPVYVEPPPPPAPPDVVLLAAPVPNPFTDAVTVRYGVPARMPVRLAAYDVLGREVAVLVEGEVEAGEHAATLDAAMLPSGLYLLVFEAASERRTLTAVKTQ